VNLEPSDQLKMIYEVTDGRPATFLQHLRARAKELAPDYPWSKDDAFEWLWAITATLEGCEMANNDLHARVKELEEKLEERNRKEWVEKE